MAVIDAVNREMVMKIELVVKCPGSEALVTYFVGFPEASIVSLRFATYTSPDRASFEVR